MLGRVVRDAPDQRESEPIVNVAATLLGAAVLTVAAFAATRGLVRLVPSPEGDALPVGFAVVLIAYFGLVVRRNAVVQIVGFLLLENGIAVVAVLASAGVSLTVELGGGARPVARGARVAGPHHPNAREVRRVRTRPSPRVDRLMLLLAVLLLPVVPAIATGVFGWRKPMVATQLAAAIALLGLAVLLAVRVLDDTTLRFGGGVLRADALAAFMVLVVAAVGLLAAWSATGYINTELANGHTSLGGARLFGSLVPMFVATMLLALLAGNAAISWVAIEGTTIATVFLVGHHRTRRSLEASWKYVIIGSVGIALAFLGTVVLAYAARAAGVPSADALNWDTLTTVGARSRPSDGAPCGRLVAPRLRHQGRPGTDAHLASRRAQPSTRTRVRAHVRGAARGGVLGVLTTQGRDRRRRRTQLPARSAHRRGAVVVGGCRVAHDRPTRRQTAPRILEHRTHGRRRVRRRHRHPPRNRRAALARCVAHALGKSVAFLAVGELPLVEGTSRISELRGLLTRRPVLGGCLALAIIGLLGLPPFGLFASEVAVARAGLNAQLAWPTAAVFVGLIVASGALLYQAQRLLLGTSPNQTAPTPAATQPRSTLLIPLVGGLVAFAVLGVTIWPIERLLHAAAQVITR